MDNRNQRRHAARMITLGLAATAELGKVDVETLSAALITVNLTCPDDDPLAQALNQFTDDLPQAQHSPRAMAELGKRLWHVVRWDWSPRSENHAAIWRADP